MTPKSVPLPGGSLRPKKRNPTFYQSFLHLFTVAPITLLKMPVVSQNTLASRFRALHKPGDPVVLCNVYDAVTAAAITTVSGAKAVATASYAIAAAQGLKDDDMSYEQNVTALRALAPVVLKAGLPLTVDLQDGYEDVSKTVCTAIELGAVGCNIEDADNRTGKLRSVEEATRRIKEAVTAAKNAGLPDFCVNARTDVIGHEGSVEDAIERAKAFLAVGASTAFVWGGGKRELTMKEIETLCEALDGRLSIMMSLAPEALTLKELRDIGVSRVSVGPALQFKAMEAFKKAAEDMLSS
jgi:2-methylisocitrate lyase-like PEP mutase family enzyme